MNDLAGLRVLLSSCEPFDFLMRRLGWDGGVVSGQRRQNCAAYLVVSRPHQSIIAQVAADVGRDDFTVDAITRDKVFVLSCGGRPRGGLVSRSSRHGLRRETEQRRGERRRRRMDEGLSRDDS